ncbi:hypothetical protein, partial [Pseudomonas aeruginosa]|uniref:hypothetical protein n=1 Tax=Pseudomonas aeruginosa TaxID=287 RepID=UPI0031B6A858
CSILIDFFQTVPQRLSGWSPSAIGALAYPSLFWHVSKQSPPHTRTVVFSELPKTSTGKIQKYVLREWAAAL